MSTQPTQGESPNRLLAALGYPIWLIALVIILTDMKKDPFMRHHGWTALFWGIAWFIVFMALNIITNLPFFGWLFFLTGGLMQLAWFITSLWFAWQAFNGKEVSIPVVSDFAKRYSTPAS